MILPGYGDLSLVLSDTVDNEYYQLLQQKLRAYNRRAALRMEPPDAVPLNIWVEDRAGHIVGGLAALT
ncbi:MAG TPA: hypothetical protein VER55_04745, partial [Ardenticatenaceae bacterium]|nr:hypothetical protein [Ardenticatenaceae bacterium]